jgi:Flagellar biosynthesis/type III secretory pathway lipoprotein
MATTTAAALQDPLGAFRQMNMNQRFTWLAGLAALIALVIVTLMWTSRLDYQVLYTNLSERDGGAVIGELQKLNIPYRITGGGAVIEVPSAQVYATRMKLAANGLPKGAGVGFEVLDHEPMGTSQFVERVNYQRALEGSLGRTIESLSAVQSATVHLAIPKPSVFLSEPRSPRPRCCSSSIQAGCSAARRWRASCIWCRPPWRGWGIKTSAWSIRTAICSPQGSALTAAFSPTS